MIKTIEVSGKTEEEAIELALEQLNLSRDDVSVEIIERAKTGFLGIKNTPAIVSVQYEVAQELTSSVETFLQGLFERMDIQVEMDIAESGDAINVVLTGKDPGALIGRRGETLDAVQHLTNYVINRGNPSRVRINIDAENYRQRRNDTLESLAVRTAEKVVKYRRNMTLDPMNAYERHIIHAALQDNNSISTFSIGTDPNRRIVIAYGSNSSGRSVGSSHSSSGGRYRTNRDNSGRRSSSSSSSVERTNSQPQTPDTPAQTETNTTQYREWS